MRTFKAVVEVEFHVSDTLYEKFGSDEVIQKKFEEQLMWELKAKEYKPKVINLEETKNSVKENKKKAKTDIDKIIEESDEATPPVKKKRKRRTKAEMEEARRNGEA